MHAPPLPRSAASAMAKDRASPGVRTPPICSAGIGAATSRARLHSNTTTNTTNSLGGFALRRWAPKLYDCIHMSDVQFFVFDSTLGSEENPSPKILFYHPASAPATEQCRAVGL